MSDAVRMGLVGTIVEDILRQLRRQVFGHVTAVVWVSARLAAFDFFSVVLPWTPCVR